MQPTLCSRCHKNVAVIFIQKIEGGETKSEGLCLKCARELGINKSTVSRTLSNSTMKLYRSLRYSL